MPAADEIRSIGLPLRLVLTGRPRSIQSFQSGRPEKSDKYPQWRKIVSEKVRLELKRNGFGDGIEPIIEEVRVSLIWAEEAGLSGSAPDIDNFAKPYLDALKTNDVLLDDSQVVEIAIARAHIAEVAGYAIPAIADAMRSAAYREARALVILTVSRLKLSRTLGFVLKEIEDESN